MIIGPWNISQQKQKGKLIRNVDLGSVQGKFQPLRRTETTSQCQLVAIGSKFKLALVYVATTGIVARVPELNIVCKK